MRAGRGAARDARRGLRRPVSQFYPSNSCKKKGVYMRGILPAIIVIAILAILARFVGC